MPNRTMIQDLYQNFEADFAALIGSVRFSADINLRLERIEHLLSLLGNPHQAYPSIHVGGTSGKGSTSTMIATMLTAAGYRTGLHMSPHLQLMNERHQINNQIASTSRLVELFAHVKLAMATVAQKNPFGAPSYFEAQVALAFYYFQQEAVDIAVIEVGLGGYIDATNVLKADVAVLTNVGLDHTAILGDTIEKIIRDKAGIIKPNQKVVSGVKQPSARQIVAKRCKAKEAELWQLGETIKYNPTDGVAFSLTLPNKTYNDLELKMQGNFQLDNAACAVAAVEILPDFDIPESAICKGLLNAHIPGRMEVVQRDPTVILDGAHNPEKMKAVCQLVEQNYHNQPKIVVLALKSDKAAEDVLPSVLKGTKKLILTHFLIKGLWEPMDAQYLAELSRQIAPDVDIQVIVDPLEAIEQAVTQAEIDDLILVTGSLYLVGDVREYWYPSAELIDQAEHGIAGALIV